MTLVYSTALVLHKSTVSFTATCKSTFRADSCGYCVNVYKITAEVVHCTLFLIMLSCHNLSRLSVYINEV